jgi:uncharacterized membrane protein HdeD (DUF308 family)
MEVQEAFEEQVAKPSEIGGRKPLDMVALVLSIVTVAAAAFVPLVSYVSGIVGLVFSIRHRKEKNTTLALLLCVVGLILAIAFHVCYALVLLS